MVPQVMSACEVPMTTDCKLGVGVVHAPPAARISVTSAPAPITPCDWPSRAWLSDPVAVNVPPVPRMDLENWLWKTHKIRIRGGDPNKLRLSTPYYLQKKDIDRFLEKFDEYKREKKL